MIFCEDVTQTLAAVVYWIRKPQHEDITSQGYVGVSINVVNRLRQHNQRAKQSKSRYKKLYKNIRSSNNVVLDIVFEGSVENCYSMEALLRPSANIGWNTTSGGRDGDTSGKYQSEVYFKHNPLPEIPSFQDYKSSLEAEIQSLEDEHYNLGKTHVAAFSSEDRKRRGIRKRIQNLSRGPWWNPAVTEDALDIYKMSDFVYEVWINNGRPSDRRLSSLIGCKGRPKTVKTLVKMFREGFVPYKDERWLGWKTKLNED